MSESGSNDAMNAALQNAKYHFRLSSGSQAPRMATLAQNIIATMPILLNMCKETKEIIDISKTAIRLLSLQTGLAPGFFFFFFFSMFWPIGCLSYSQKVSS